jgi:nitroreductase
VSRIELLEGLTSTRAIRRFTTDPIAVEDLNRILFAASRAPSGSNRQPFRFLVLRDGPTANAAKALLATAFADAWASKKFADGYHKVDPTSPTGRLSSAMEHLIDHFVEVPAVVLACTTPRHGGLLDGASIYPACQNLLLAARGLGYGGVLTGWHVPVERELKVLCGIPDNVAIAATIPLGVPHGRHGPVRRRPLAELVFEDRWDEPAPWAVDPEGTRFTN